MSKAFFQFFSSSENHKLSNKLLVGTAKQDPNKRSNHQMSHNGAARGHEIRTDRIARNLKSQRFFGILNLDLEMLTKWPIGHRKVTQ